MANAASSKRADHEVASLARLLRASAPLANRPFADSGSSMSRIGLEFSCTSTSRLAAPRKAASFFD